MTTVPAGFWPQIDHQLHRIAERAANFDSVRAILLDERYDEIARELSRNGARTFDADSAFFAGSGGNNDLHGALLGAGWRTVAMESKFHFAMRAPGGDLLTYLEGDVHRGDRVSSPRPIKSSELVAREAMDKVFGIGTEWEEPNGYGEEGFTRAQAESDISADDIIAIIVSALEADRAQR